MSNLFFNIDLALQHIEKAVKPYPKAALFELAERGYASPFELLVTCIISIRTTDEVMLPTALALFGQARTPQAISQLSLSQLDHLIRACTFHERKAGQIQTIAQKVVAQYDGHLPCEREVLLSFKGVGPKCANLVMGIACDKPQIGVDIHVHRITNRWGYVETKTPEQTTKVLEEQLPPRHWVKINRLLVPFGKHICTGPSPHCTKCPISEMCQRVAVKSYR